jgi:SAM-dependent methyltransferase
MSDPDWWQTFFDAEYLEVWAPLHGPERCEDEADVLWELLRLDEGSTVLDAPCGAGRLCFPLARRGARVTGVDYSADLLAAAEAEIAELELGDEIELYRADLRDPLDRRGFDAAINMFSSLGYGTDSDDLAIFETTAAALKPGGRYFVDTMHRDVVVARRARGARTGSRLEDGTLMVEDQRFDPLSGRIETTWHWSGAGKSGQKSASIRTYTATEILGLAERAGFALVSAHEGVSLDPFTGAGIDAGGRLGLLLERR